MSLDDARLRSLKQISFHRVMDNERIVMTAEDLWIHLNFQLIHLLDFIPASNWAAQMEDLLFQGTQLTYPVVNMACR